MKKCFIAILALFCSIQLTAFRRGGVARTAVVASAISNNRDYRSDAYYESRDRERQRSEERKERERQRSEKHRQIKDHKSQTKTHQKKLNKLNRDHLENSQAAQYHREQITHHKGIVAEIEQELREL